MILLTVLIFIVIIFTIGITIFIDHGEVIEIDDKKMTDDVETIFQKNMEDSER